MLAAEGAVTRAVVVVVRLLLRLGELDLMDLWYAKQSFAFSFLDLRLRGHFELCRESRGQGRLR